MKRLVSFSAAVAFTAWILPLGFFIKPSQEKTACGGQRPFHMCSMMKGMMPRSPKPAGVSIQNGAPEKAPKASSGTAGDDFLVKQRRFVFGNSASFVHETLWLVPSNPFLHPLDPVPKF